MVLKQSAVAAALAVAATAAQAAAFTNGGFESPNILGFQSVINLATAPTGWVPGGVLQNSSLFMEDSGNFFSDVSQEGGQMLGFGGNGTAGAIISQTFDTVLGTTYQVSYFVTAQQLGTGPQSYSAQALNGATVLGSDSGSIPAARNWVQHQFSFVAAGTSSTLVFTDTSNGSAAVEINWALDNVQVNGLSAPPPNPTPVAPTLALMLVALAGLPATRALKRRRG